MAKFRHVQYNRWANDKELPPVADLVSFVRDLKVQVDEMHINVYGQKTGRLMKQRPLVTLCPTGATRCGLLVAIDVVTRAVDARAEISVPAIVRTLRDSRYGTVATFDQYVYIYLAAIEASRQWAIPRTEIGHRRLRSMLEKLQSK